PIVIETAKEFNLSYHQFKSFGAALISHQKMLWSLGRA
ncbi:MAG: acyl-CoA desaturase, partial [Bacteroidia bacterium]|nr:acyl-CoA desaturase [Bacteroidia bacterium]